MESYEKFVGQTLEGRYHIEKIVGIGGMAVVFRAHDTVIRRAVAVKMLKDDVAKDESAVKRFINESKAVAMLSHPNIVSIYDVSVSGEYKYIVMEYIEGITLKSYMTKKGALPMQETISYCDQILKALIHAHSKGIVHRDIKPQNIMLLKNGVVKVTDFGIAKLPNAETVTMTDKAIGTVYYISPEQASGFQIDTRSDLYSTGILMYEMTTGRLPFIADTPVSVALMQVNTEPVPPTQISPDIPKGLEQIILTAMEKTPDKRFQTAEQMEKRLQILKENPSAVFKPLPSPIVRQGAAADKPKKKPSKRAPGSVGANSMLPIILGVAFAFLIVCIICAYYLLANVFFNSDLDKSYVLTVENFVGTEYRTEMDSELAARDYTVFVTYVYDSDAPAGVIVEQTPEANEKRRVETGKTSCEIYFTVSRGIETFVMPDFTMQDYRNVEDTLSKRYGVITSIVEDYNIAVATGYVYRTEPAEGATITTGEKVTLYVSRGMDIGTAIVPDFYLLTELDARIQIEKNNLKVGAVSYEYSSEPAGVILKQSRVAYTTVLEGTAIDFIVSCGPDPSTQQQIQNQTQNQIQQQIQ